MNTDELVSVIEQGLKDVRGEIFKRKHPNTRARKAMPPETRLDELEWKMYAIESDLSRVKSTVHVLEMNVAKLRAANAENTKPSPETRRSKARSGR